LVKKKDKLDKALSDAFCKKVVYPDLSDINKGLNIPSCYGLRDEHIRKPVKFESEIAGMVEKSAACTTCLFHNSCTYGKIIDLGDQILMFLRFLHTESKLHTGLLKKLCKMVGVTEGEIESIVDGVK